VGGVPWEGGSERDEPVPEARPGRLPRCPGLAGRRRSGLRAPECLGLKPRSEPDVPSDRAPPNSRSRQNDGRTPRQWPLTHGRSGLYPASANRSRAIWTSRGVNRPENSGLMTRASIDRSSRRSAVRRSNPGDVPVLRRSSRAAATPPCRWRVRPTSKCPAWRRGNAPLWLTLHPGRVLHPGSRHANLDWSCLRATR